MFNFMKKSKNPYAAIDKQQKQINDSIKRINEINNETTINSMLFTQQLVTSARR